MDEWVEGKLTELGVGFQNEDEIKTKIKNLLENLRKEQLDLIDYELNVAYRMENIYKKQIDELLVLLNLPTSDLGTESQAILDAIVSKAVVLEIPNEEQPIEVIG